MHHFFEFILKHWTLSGLFVLLLATLFYEENKANSSRAAISAQEVINRMNNQHAKVIDLRTNSLFEKSHIIGSVSMPTTDAHKLGEQLEKWQEKPIIFVCDPGQASGPLLMKLKKKGFENIATLAGGMKEWDKQNLPTTKGRK